MYTARCPKTGPRGLGASQANYKTIGNLSSQDYREFEIEGLVPVVADFNYKTQISHVVRNDIRETIEHIRFLTFAQNDIKNQTINDLNHQSAQTLLSQINVS